MTDREAIRQRLLATFKIEAREHTTSLSRNLVALEHTESAQASRELVEVIFRDAHSLKGAARSVSLARIEAVCQAMESVFAAMKRGTLAVSAELVDLLLAAVRTLEQLLVQVDAEGSDSGAPIERVITALKAALDAPPRETRVRTQSLHAALVAPGQALDGETPREAARAEAPSPEAPSPEAPSPEAPASVHPGRPDSSALGPEPQPAQDVVRVPTRRLEKLRLFAEEFLPEKLGAERHAEELMRLRDSVSEFRKRMRRIQQGAPRVLGAPRGEHALAHDAALETRFAELVEQSGAFVEQLDHQLKELSGRARQSQRNLAAKIDSLQSESRELLMLPCAWLLDGLPQVVRDLARDLGKNVELTLQGQAVELDRRILTELRDPFLHALRNAIDHGIEAPSERVRARKPQRGRISIEVGQIKGNRVEISISDDGRGIDVERVREAAARLQLAERTALAELERPALLDLVFASALSTSPLITDLSGRGLGLAIVRERVEKLGGSISIASEPGVGTALKLVLPLSLATFRGVVVRLADQLFVLPSANVLRALRAGPDEIRTLGNRDSIRFEGDAIPLLRLARVLGLESSASPSRTRNQALLLSAAGQRSAFVVDEVCEEQDVLVKPLGRELAELNGVLGATLLGSGKLAPILDPAELMRKALHTESEPARASEGAKAQRKRSILVAEDSITSRTLLKTILEGAGFAVTTAVDGADALARLRTGDFDLVVSDVDMPRMNGFALIQRIRADKKFAELPVVLVTSLESREDRERGIEVGANAYIVKRSFEQSNLLEAIQRLV